ncbi:MAG: insulinase family protein, partial [Deltaproteobacteria bacterium]|nr:insulinase family protein [Deltaproteobacteria bacterium]
MSIAPLLFLLAACVPHVEAGPSVVAKAQAPVRLVTLPDPGSPNVYLQAIAAAGSARDPVGQEGLAWLTARSMVEAGAGTRSGQTLKEALYPTGNEIEQVIDREWVSFRLTCHRDHASLCLELFTEVLLDPRFDDADVVRLRDEALYQVTQGLLADEEALGGEVLDTWMFEGHPYGHPVMGRAGVLPLLDAEAARSFHARHYVREAVIGGIAGAFDPALVAAFQDRLDALPGVRAPELVLQSPAPIEGRTLLAVDTTTEVTGFHLGHPLSVDRNHPDWPALYLGVAAFGVHRQVHGRLFRSLRGDRGLNYGTYAYMEPFVQRGWTTLPEQGVLRRQPHFSLWIRPNSIENGPFALKLALDELERLVTDGLEEGEYERNRSYLHGHLASEAHDPGRRLAYALDAAATETPNLLEHVPV